MMEQLLGPVVVSNIEVSLDTLFCVEKMVRALKSFEFCGSVISGLLLG